MDEEVTEHRAQAESRLLIWLTLAFSALDLSSQKRAVIRPTPMTK